MGYVTRSSIIFYIAISFFGGFLGAIGVASAKYFLAVLGFTPQLKVSLQWLQNFSWGGAMWGIIPAIFLILKRGNIYLISLLTMIIAVSYENFVLQGLAPIISSQIIFTYLINVIYVLILAVTIVKTRILVEHKFIFQNLLPSPATITQKPKQFFTCPHCKRKFEKFLDFSNHIQEHQ